jgi:hypothetical protein
VQCRRAAFWDCTAGVLDWCRSEDTTTCPKEYEHSLSVLVKLLQPNEACQVLEVKEALATFHWGLKCVLLRARDQWSSSRDLVPVKRMVPHRPEVTERSWDQDSVTAAGTEHIHPTCCQKHDVSACHSQTLSYSKGCLLQGGSQAADSGARRNVNASGNSANPFYLCSED